jgi:hypothetical protein
MRHSPLGLTPSWYRNAFCKTKSERPKHYHIAHLQFCGKLDVMSIMIITRTHFYLTPARRSENTTRLSFQKEGCGIAIWIISDDDVDTFKDLFSKIQNISNVSKTKNFYLFLLFSWYKTTDLGGYWYFGKKKFFINFFYGYIWKLVSSLYIWDSILMDLLT